MKMQMLLAAGLMACGSALGAGASADGMVYVGAEKSVLWRTATTSPARLALDWPAGAVKARLTVTAGPNGKSVDTFITDTSLDYYDYAFEVPAKPADERVATLTIVYLDGEDATVSSATAKLGIVQGTANGGKVPCLVKGTDDTRWPRFTNKAVLPIPSDASNIRLDGTVVEATPDSPGWWQTLLPMGTHALTMAIGGEDVTRSIRVNGGFIVTLR